MQEGKLHSDNPTPEVIPLQKGAQNSREFWGKIPGFQAFLHMQKRQEKNVSGKPWKGIMEELGSAGNHSSQKLWPFLHIRKSPVGVENFLMAFWAIPGIPGEPGNV